MKLASVVFLCLLALFTLAAESECEMSQEPTFPTPWPTPTPDGRPTPIPTVTPTPLPVAPTATPAPTIEEKCLDSDGSFGPLVEKVLAEHVFFPETFEHGSTLIYEWGWDQDELRVQMFFWAENAFGMRIEHVAEATINEDCILLALVRMEEVP